jgi:hypothetical protein
MHKVFNFIFLSVFFSFSPCEEDSYRFVNTVYEKFQMDLEIISEISFGRYAYISTFSGRLTQDLQDVDHETNKMKIFQSWSNIIASNRRNDEVKPNYGAQKLNGATYVVIIDSTGMVESVVGNNDVANESLEQQNSMSEMFASQNYYYPFGSDSLRRVGDVWIIKKDEKAEESLFGVDNFEGTIEEEITYTFKKVKEKKGDLIAYIRVVLFQLQQGVITNWDDTIEFTLAGELKGEVRFNITKGYMTRAKMSGKFYGKGKSLDNDSSMSYSTTVDVRVKTKIK